MTFFYDLNKKLAGIADKSETKQLNEGAVAEAGYSAKAARAGKDIGKPGKNFEKIAKSAGERYGSRERGEKVAGAVLAKLRGKNESVEEGNDGNLANNAKPYDKVTRGDVIAGRLGKDEMGGKAKRVKEADMDESALQAYLGKKKYGEQGMKALQKAGREGASKEKMDRIRDQHDKMDEGWDDMMKDVERRRAKPAVGSVERGHKHDIEHTATGRKVTRRTDDQGYSVGADDDTEGQPVKKSRGRPKGTGKAMGAKGPSGKSKLMTKEAEHDSAEVKQAMAVLKKAGYKISKAGAEELEEKAVSQQQQKFMGMAHAMQKGEKIKGASAELKKVAKTMKPKDVEDFAATKHKGLPKKVKAKKEVEETTVSGSVAPAAEAPKSKGKGGMTFGKGIYDSMNRELESMIAESMNISMNMNSDEHGGPSKSLTVTATDEDAMYLGKLLKMAGVGGGDAGCGCGQQPCACNSADQVDENAPDWPTDEVESDDALQYSGGLNKPKSTGQTTVPVIAGQENRMATYEGQDELARIREIAGIQEAAKPDYIDLDKDGNKKESMKKAAADKGKDKKVEESILGMANLWKEYKTK